LNFTAQIYFQQNGIESSAHMRESILKWQNMTQLEQAVKYRGKKNKSMTSINLTLVQWYATAVKIN